jgi:hypothetical protein
MGEVKWSDVKAIAESQVGYEEGPNNWTKYAEDLDAIHYFNSDKQNVPWCATYTSWCFYKAADPDPKGTALAAQYQPKNDNCGCGVPWNARYYKDAGEFYSEPREGDVFFTKGYNHTGFVKKILDSQTFLSNEGNHNNKVDEVVRNISDMEGFGRPWWTPEDYPTPKPGKNIYIDIKAPEDCEVIVNINKILED